MSSRLQLAPPPPPSAPPSVTGALLPLLLPFPPPPLLLPPELASGFVAEEEPKHAGIKNAGSEAKQTAALDTPTRTIIGIFTSAPLSLNGRIDCRKDPRAEAASHHPMVGR